MVHETLGQEISGLRASYCLKSLPPIPARSPARDDDVGGRLWTHPIGCEGSEGSKGSKGSEGGGSGFAADYKKGGRGWRRRLGRRVVSPQGKRLTMICASLALLHPLLSLTHWIFRSLMLPYKSSSHSANHVCCASLRSGSKNTRKLAAFPMDMQGFETSTHRKLSL